MTPSRTERIAQGFNDRSLPHAEWNHEAHLRVGLWHVLRYPPDVALNHLRTRIRAYNEACGVENSDTSGYHETITRAYVVLIADFVGSRSRNEPLEQLADALVDALGSRDLLLEYFSRSRLMSPRARRTWVEPDCMGLPPTPYL